MSELLNDTRQALFDKKTPVVAIGASAGGLEALLELVKYLPKNTGMAYFYIQHLDPAHPSSLTAIVSRTTSMEVLEAEDQMKVEQNKLYIIPPNKEMSLIDGHIRVAPRPSTPYTHMPINVFFTSLADKYEEAAIGIVLSGAATDGSRGLRAIKLNGGLTFAQDNSAKFQSMPQTAIAEGSVDLVLSPKEMAEELGKIAKQKEVYYAAINEGQPDMPDHEKQKEIEGILVLLNKSTGVDFREYKLTTIRRRIIRRMMLHKLTTLADYLQYLRQNAKEVHLLYNDLLINVTSFFRDEAMNEYMKSEILPAIINSKSASESIRIWVPACSTGQEVYSIAILLFEALGNKTAATPIQIFATDISEAAIQRARLGMYTATDVADVSPQRLATFFVKIDGHYRIVKSIRDVCVFAPHNIAKDPPFSRLDLISCCNLLIYLNIMLQKRLFSIFHYSLNRNGFLVLGKSETAGASSSLFTVLDKKLKVYTKSTDGVPPVADISYRLPKGERTQVATESIRASRQQDFELDKAIDEALLKKYTPASVVVTEQLDILQFRGSAGVFLEPMPGKASLNLLKMARSGLGIELRNVVHKAKKTGAPARKDGLRLMHDGNDMMVAVEAIPLNQGPEQELFLVLFEREQISAAAANVDAEADARVKQLEGELIVLREDMRSIIESLEAANEELQSANEEVVSSNEELQSINEELETSREEIESTNEELVTINQELMIRNDQLAEAQVYADAVSLIMVHENLLMLDKDLRIKMANPSFFKTFQVNEMQTYGKMLYDLGNGQWDIPRLRELLKKILTEASQLTDYEVSHSFPQLGERIMLLNAKKIMVLKEPLILLAIEDVTEKSMAERAEGM